MTSWKAWSSKVDETFRHITNNPTFHTHLSIPINLSWDSPQIQNRIQRLGHEQRLFQIDTNDNQALFAVAKATIQNDFINKLIQL